MTCTGYCFHIASRLLFFTSKMDGLQSKKNILKPQSWLLVHGGAKWGSILHLLACLLSA